MTRIHIGRWGNSAAIRLPKALLNALRAHEGDTLLVEAVDGVLTLRPAGRRRLVPSLEDMVAEMKRRGLDHAPDLVNWGPDRGAEVIRD